MQPSYTCVAGVGFICWFDACLCGAAVFGCEPNLVIDVLPVNLCACQKLLSTSNAREIHITSHDWCLLALPHIVAVVGLGSCMINVMLPWIGHEVIWGECGGMILRMCDEAAIY